ncbi:ATP-binding protein [Listeria innocua]|nr:ATP-binding protein [Listeria innocua]EKD7152043.1 ATP-binding protein [Listeria innocua]EKK7208454.1 ATP-binding protein [Listeria innocua]HBN5051443.1 ATP-binding protein [Listeria innocua]
MNTIEKNINKYLTIKIGTVYNVDTRKIIVFIEDETRINKLKIHDLVIFEGLNTNQKLVGMVTKISKKIIEVDEDNEFGELSSENIASIVLVGTYKMGVGRDKKNTFTRAVDTYPEINSDVYLAENEVLSIIMNSLSSSISNDKPFKIGSFANKVDVDAILDGNKFFQRHAAIVGSTGSGKSYTTARMLEKIDELKYSNVVVFDLHGEYNELSYAKQIKIGSGQSELKMPLWFFKYEEIHSLFIESAAGTSGNKRAVVIEYILEKRKEYILKILSDQFHENVVTADTPIPFSAIKLLEYLKEKDIEVVETGGTYNSGDKKGMPKTKQGQHHGQLTSLINRLETKVDDKKYSFVFNEEETSEFSYLNKFINEILEFRDKRIKIIDVSEVPADMLPIVIGVITRIIYDIQFWTTPRKEENRHPVLFVCDEAHIYMPHNTANLPSTSIKSLNIFERIAKEGRKYGVGLLIVSQRPSELNTTIVSQCNNLISLRISNDRDKSAVASLLTDSLSGLTEVLPNLEIGECMVVGDAIMLPSKIILDEPSEKPKSATIPFWDKWHLKENSRFDIEDALNNMIKQYRG